MKIILLIMFLSLAAFTGQAVAEPPLSATSPDKKSLPAAAESVIRRAIGFAEKKELENLRKLMIKKFVWSFGGDEDADQAIAEWRNEPKILKELVQVLQAGCSLRSTDRVECPGAGNGHYRAGFQKTSTGWLMEYFVAGD